MDAGTVEKLAGDLGVWFYTIPIVIFVIVNADKLKEIVQLFERKDDNRLKVINDYLNGDDTDSQLRDAFLEIRDAIYFQRIFGVYGSQDFRDAFLNLHNEVSTKINPRTLARAAEYMTERDGQIRISIPKGALIEYWYNYFSVILFIGASVYLSTLIATGIDPVSIIFPIISLCFGVYAIRELAPVRVANKVKTLVKNT